ncbi:hypothetical protein DLJ53_20515 [Acuticoccus sediminis]|uniref:Amidohydrolase-related domain-containing protein n=1 Tax=Acuticoccus sediminis TaxID=2184697 RepID=A0A8B2NRW4_9HYPH|nr:amidohydrolase family protein [Acuticoccus sediminis]RAI00103.1 hypothetical protein DLJ53_20515 [Acuticoccus sediminis]
MADSTSLSVVPAAPARPARTLLRASIVDGTGAAPFPGAVLVEGDRIAAVGAADDIGFPDGTEVIDAAGRTLVPGLIDAHVHLAYSGAPTKAAFRNEHAEMSYPAIALRAAGYARATLAHGITAVRDMHAPGGVIIDLRDAIAAGHVEGPRIRACGRGLSVTGGHMDQPGWGDQTRFDGLTQPCDGADGFRRGVRLEAKRGADFIKLNTCGPAYGGPGAWCRLEMAPDEIGAACDEAHRKGLKVASHTTGEEALAETIRRGVDCVEHAHFTDDAVVELMVRSGTVFVPTLLVNERNFEIDRATQGVSPVHWRWLEASRTAKWETMARAKASGVTIACGTDAGFQVTHGAMYWRELALLVEGGLSPMEALCAATATNADLLELEAGRIRPGLLADLVLVDGDPLADLSILGDPARLSVMKGGRWCGAGADRPVLP